MYREMSNLLGARNLSILVNNSCKTSGDNGGKHFDNLELTRIETLLNANVHGMTLITWIVCEYMMKQRSKCAVINVVGDSSPLLEPSCHNFHAMTSNPIYQATKAYQQELSMQLYHHYHPTFKIDFISDYVPDVSKSLFLSRLISLAF